MSSVGNLISYKNNLAENLGNGNLYTKMYAPSNTILQFLQRNQQLLDDLRNEGRRSRFVDNRLSERHSRLSDAQKEARRLAHLRKKQARLTTELAAEENPDFIITHRGAPITELDDATLASPIENYADDDGSDGEALPADLHFGTGAGQDQRTRQQVYAEIIEKSKRSRTEKARLADEQTSRLEKLDTALKDIQGLIAFKSPRRAATQEQLLESVRSEASEEKDDDSAGYDALLKSLAFDPRSKPTDRVKTAADLAIERVRWLAELEDKRQAMESVERQEMESEETRDEDTEEEEEEEEGSDAVEDEDDDDGEEEEEDEDDSTETYTLTQESPDSQELNSAVTISFTPITPVNSAIPLIPTLSIPLLDDSEDGPPAWAVNTPEEKGLPFQIEFPETLEDLKYLLNPYDRQSQWKLLWRLRAKHDVAVDSKNHGKLQKLLIYLLQYVLDLLTAQFGEINKQSPNHVVDHLQYLEIHIKALTVNYSATTVSFFLPRILSLSRRTFPTLQLRPAVLAALEEAAPYEPDITPQESKLGPADLAFMFLATIIFPTSLEYTHHPILTPLTLLLDFWTADICKMPHATFAPQSETDTPSASSSVLPEFRSENDSRLGLIFLAVHLSLFNDGTVFCVSTFPLACALLRHYAKHEGICLQLCNTITRLLQDISRNAAGLASADVLCLNIVLPTTRQLLVPTSSLPKKCGSHVNELQQFATEMVKQPLPRLHLAPTIPQGIRMLTPRYVDPRHNSLWLRLKGADEKLLAVKSLKRHINSERKGAAREIKKDAVFLAAMQAKTKHEQVKKRDANYKRVVGMLEKEQQDLHQMRTSVEGGGQRNKVKKTRTG